MRWTEKARWLPTTGIFAVLIVLGASCSCPESSRSAIRRSSLKKTKGFVQIRAGSFVMGSPEDEANRYTNEAQHKVTLTRDFEIAATEVTQDSFKALMGYNPSTFSKCSSCPVETVNWFEAAAYCNALSKKNGLSPCYACEGSGPQVRCEVAVSAERGKIYDCPGYRLPTDAEWEYAYRAGTSTPYYNGTNEARFRVDCSQLDPLSDAIGWYCANSDKKTHPVGKKKPNAWGLYDMAGNVWEWCHDKYLAVLVGPSMAVDPWGIASSSMRVVRGGAWRYYARGMRAAHRAWYKTFYRGSRHGFRPARTLSGR